MKNINYLLLLALVLSSTLFVSAQQIANLEGINYQAVALDDEGKEIVGIDIMNKPLYEKSIGVRFTITAGVDGAVYYQDTHTTITDKYGLFSLVIGKGTVVDGTNLMDIPWINGDQWLKVEIAIHNDGNYKVVSNQQFMSVPYSFYTDDIADDAITTAKILNEEILSEDINNETILAEDIGTGSVETSEILNETILAEDIATSAVETSEILDETILSEDISNGTILNEDVADGTLDLITKVTNQLPVANGGTGLSNIPTGNIVVGNGTSALNTLAVSDSIMLFSNKSGQTELYKLAAGLRTNLSVDEVTKTVFISAIDQSGGPNKDYINFSTGNIPIGGQQLRVIPYPGVRLGDIILATATSDLEGVTMTAYVSTDDKINVVFFNGTGSPRNLGGQLKIANFGQ